MKSFNILVSFAEGEKEVMKYLRPGWNVLLDSGAFTNFAKGRDVVSLDGYCDFLKSHGDKFWRYFALDKIADSDRSKSNLRTMYERGLRPVPVFQRGATIADMDEMKKTFGRDRCWRHRRTPYGHRA